MPVSFPKRRGFVGTSTPNRVDGSRLVQFKGYKSRAGVLCRILVSIHCIAARLGSMLLARAAQGFRDVGLRQMHLEVTTDNTAAIRLYERQGFKRVHVVYKAAEVVGV